MNWDYSVLQRGVVSGEYSGLQRVKQNYAEECIKIYSPWIGTTVYYKRGVVSGEYSGLQRVKQNYSEE